MHIIYYLQMFSPIKNKIQNLNGLSEKGSTADGRRETMKYNFKNTLVKKVETWNSRFLKHLFDVRKILLGFF